MGTLETLRETWVTDIQRLNRLILRCGARIWDVQEKYSSRRLSLFSDCLGTVVCSKARRLFEVVTADVYQK